MQLQRLALPVLVGLALCASARADDIVPKQLAGAPDEFAAMAPLDPAAAAINSKSALIPVRMTTDKAGNRTWQGTLPVENGKARFLVFAGNGSDWDLQLVAPDGSFKAAAGALRAKHGDFGVEGD